MKICEIQPALRPYERLEQYGSEALSDEELLAIILRTGTKGRSSKDIAMNLLSKLSPQDGISGLRKLTLSELSDFEGVGRVKAIQISACLELGKRSMSFTHWEKVRFLTNEIAISYFEGKMSFLEQEEVHAVFLDTQKGLISSDLIGKGNLNGVGMCIREVFRIAVKVNAAGIILAHNHPSGDPSPSQEDIDTTRRLLECGQMMGIEFIDHIIVGRGISISMKREGYMEV